MATQLLQTTLYTKDIPAGADTLSHYCCCDRGRLFITLGTSPVLLLIKERCFTKYEDLSTSNRSTYIAWIRQITGC
eukprot:scaffold5155_cov132-Skeletonema_marinoi.AAC.4